MESNRRQSATRMKKSKSLLSPIQQPTGAGDTSFHRSGAVARMLRMPVATLRVWERRYGLTQPGLSPSGQRLYSADDIRRLALLKQLTDLGHAIGSLAPLDMAQLQRVASTHAHSLAAIPRCACADAAHCGPSEPGGWWSWALGGHPAAAPALLRRLGPPVTC